MAPPPYAPMASPACGAVNPWRVRYSARKTSTNVPNRLTRVPANSTQTGRGMMAISDRSDMVFFPGSERDSLPVATRVWQRLDGTVHGVYA
jgi:hypothetical protein